MVDNPKYYYPGLEGAVARLQVSIENGNLCPLLSKLIFNIIGNNSLNLNELHRRICRVLENRPLCVNEAKEILALALEQHESNLVRKCLFALNKYGCFVEAKNYLSLSFYLSTYSTSFTTLENELLIPLFELYELHAKSSRDNHEIKLSFSHELSNEELLEISRIYGKQLVELELFHNSILDDFTFSRVLNRIDNLKTMKIRGESNLSANTINEIKKLQHLHRLILLDLDLIENLFLDECQSLEYIEVLRSEKIKEIQLERMENLKRIDIFGCKDLQKILIKDLPNLKEIVISDCPNLSRIKGQRPSSTLLYIKNCKNLIPEI